MRMEGSLQNKTTSPAIHKLLRNVAYEQSTLPTVHDSEDDFYEETLNSNLEQDEQEVIEHCSPESADAANSPPVEIDSNLHKEAATVPPDGIGNDH